MPQLEERIVEALVRLSANVPECDRHMFVFPIPLVGDTFNNNEYHIRVVADDVVSLVCRD